MIRSLLLMIIVPSLLAGILYVCLNYPTEGLVKSAMATAETTGHRIHRLTKAMTQAAAQAKAACDGPLITSALCTKSSGASSAAVGAVVAAKSEKVQLAATLQAQANTVLALIAAQLVVVAAVAWAITRYLAGHADTNAPFFALRRSALAIIGLLVVISTIFAFNGVDPWSSPLVAAAIARAGAEAIYQPSLGNLTAAASLGFSLFAGVLAAVSVAAALLSATYEPRAKAADTIDDDLMNASVPERMAILRGLFALASLCFLITMGLVSKLGDLASAALPATGSDTAKAILTSLGDSVELYWGVGLSLLLAVIFVPPATNLLENNPDPARNSVSFMDILGDDIFKKVMAVLLLVAPAAFPFLAKWSS